MSEPHLFVTKENGLATVTIHRPHVMNALTDETMILLLEAFSSLSADEETRVILLQGAGGNFSTGADMALLGSSTDPEQSYAFMKETAGGVILAVKEAPQPVVCKVRGNAYGYAVGLALACDFVIAADSARFCEAFVNLGISLDGGSSYLLPRLAGMAKAKEMALLGDIISGREAAACGLIHKSVPDEELDKEAADLLGRLAAKSPQAVRSIKATLERGQNSSLEAALEMEAAHQSKLLAGEELQRAIHLFLESRRNRGV